ncbi:hypothetical protein CEXT_651201 [Caerostris extrusa]|uniref:Uncharacterized protein n=1 Tax=Caerostris extrusa TaxID=172846 RepID=A0AAV4Y816_CAEEX|nr:hypothetical protein CEXT_651201 [Caerostris extrusa]
MRKFWWMNFASSTGAGRGSDLAFPKISTVGNCGKSVSSVEISRSRTLLAFVRNTSRRMLRQHQNGWEVAEERCSAHSVQIPLCTLHGNGRE